MITGCNLSQRVGLSLIIGVMSAGMILACGTGPSSSGTGSNPSSSGTSTSLGSAIATATSPGASPTPEATATPEPSPTPTPVPAEANVRILQHAHYLDSIGSLYFIGVVVNKGNAPATDMEVSVTLLDSSGKVVGTGSDSLSDLLLSSGQSVGFRILVQSPPAEWAKEEVKGHYKTYDPSAAYIKSAAGLTISGDNLSPGEFGAVVRGQVKNGGAKDAQFVKVIVTGFDSAGKVVAVNDSYISGPNVLAKGETATFEVDLNRDNVAKYSLIVYGREKDS